MPTNVQKSIAQTKVQRDAAYKNARRGGEATANNAMKEFGFQPPSFID